MSKRVFNPANPDDLGFDLWFKSEPVRNLIYWKNSMKAKNMKFLTKSKHDQMPVDELIESYLDSNKRSYKNYKRVEEKDRVYQDRYGEYFLMYVGREMHDDYLIKIVEEFIYQVTYGENKLPYVVYKSKYGSAYYVHIWIADREYLDHEPLVYTRDYYHTPEGKMCGASTPGAILKRKKGEQKLDANGEPILSTRWRYKKTRIFTESYRELWPRLKDILVGVYYKVFRQVNVMLKYKEIGFDRVRINREDSEWKNKKYREIAGLQYYIKYVIHRLMSDDVDNYYLYDMGNIGIVDFKDPPTQYSLRLRNLFIRYKNIIRNGFYEDRNNQKCELFKANAIESIRNTLALKQLFKNELHEIVMQQ